MTPRRRTVFQLASLLDLLLIVMFAQYIEMRVSSIAEADQQRQARATVEQELAQARQSLQQAQSDQQATADERDELATRLDRWRTQGAVVEQLLSELFHVPSDVIDSLIRARSNDVLSESQVAELRERLQQLASTSGSEVIDHLLRYAELQKRCDLWEVYLDDAGQTSVSVGTIRATFRAETADAFANELYEFYRRLPQPKSLVLVLFSYGDARLQSRRAAQLGLPVALERMQSATSGRTRFEYTQLGLRLGSMPLLSEPKPAPAPGEPDPTAAPATPLDSAPEDKD